MLEIAIIIILALFLFLTLKNFPKTKNLAQTGQNKISDFTNVTKKPVKNFNFLKNIFKKKDSVQASQEVRDAIEKDQEKIVAPIEINQALSRYKVRDSETAKILHGANQAYDKSDLRETEKLALIVISKEKKCAYAYALIGHVALNRGVLDDAREAYKIAIKCNPELGEAYFGMGQIDTKDENYTSAIENFQRAISLDRGVAQWYGELGKTYIQVRQFSKASKALKRAASLDIDNNEYKKLASEAEDKQRAHSQVFRVK